MIFWLRLITQALTLLCAFAVQAHDGPHGPDMLAEVLSAQKRGAVVSVEVRIINLGGPLVLTGMRAEGAQPVPLGPVFLNFAEEATVTGRLQFSDPVTRGFTLLLEFGGLGHGQVTVLPDG